MRDGERFEYPDAPGTATKSRGLPYLPLTLGREGRTLAIRGLVDTGATVNVLPYEAGLRLGAAWAHAAPEVRLTGNLSNFEARALVASATVGRFAPVTLVFAWTQARDVPLILGQTNFFSEFDVCFYQSAGTFEVRPRRAL